MAAPKLLYSVPHLESWRLHRDLSQEELAQSSGIGRTTIIRVERGKPTRRNTVDRLAQALGLDREQLLSTAPRTTRKKKAEEA